MITAALEAAGWNRPAAAERLGMPLRTLRHKIKVLGIKKAGA
jgi:DNA-binding NtrC family response regulator